MTIWRNDVERDAFMESHCRTCFQPDEARKRIQGTSDGCPHLIAAEKNKYKLPDPWERRRNAQLGDTFKCSAYQGKPPVNRRGKAPADTLELFDEPEPQDRNLVPIETWPDYRAEERKQKEGDHQ